jgi:hypothetical protein
VGAVLALAVIAAAVGFAVLRGGGAGAAGGGGGDGTPLVGGLRLPRSRPGAPPQPAPPPPAERGKFVTQGMTQTAASIAAAARVPLAVFLQANPIAASFGGAPMPPGFTLSIPSPRSAVGRSLGQAGASLR